MRAQLTVGLIGAGRVAEEYWLPALASAGYRISLWDPDRSRSDALAERSKVVGAVCSPRDLVERADAGIVIASPATSHLAVLAEVDEFAKQMHLRRTVVVEKPPVTSEIELEHALRLQHVDVRCGFIRRSFSPVVLAQRLYRRWTEQYGALAGVAISEGRARSWVAISRNGGQPALDHLLLDEVTHTLDSFIAVSGLSVSTATLVESHGDGYWAFNAHLVLLTPGGSVPLEISSSRIKAMANLIRLNFANATISIEMRPAGGISILPRLGERYYVKPQDPFLGVRAALAAMVGDRDPRPTASLEEWRSPVRIIDAGRQNP